jgi:hypothetical protein
MSEFTFNIADYRPLSGVRVQRVNDRRPMVKRPAGFVVLSSNSAPGEQESKWMDTRPAIVDIRSMRDDHRNGHLGFHVGSYSRRGKVLRFTNEAPERVYTMATHDDRVMYDDDPDPSNFPPSAA